MVAPDFMTFVTGFSIKFLLLSHMVWTLFSWLDPNSGTFLLRSTKKRYSLNNKNLMYEQTCLLCTDHLSLSLPLHPNPAPHAFAQCLFLFLASTAGHPQPATSGPRVKSELGSKEFESLSHRRLRRKNPHLNVILDSQI